MAVVGYRVYVENAGAGGSANPAIVQHFADPALTSHEFNLAHIIATITGYSSVAVNTSISGAEWFPLTTGSGATSLPFPVDEYGLLVDEFPAEIPAIDSYGDVFGAGALTVLGVGLVMDRITAQPGRSYTGRVTSPWLATSAVSNGGQLVPAGIGPINAGWNTLLVARCQTYVYSRKLAQTNQIIEYSARSRLGRQSRRTR